MKIILTVDLQEDAGQSVLKASQTKPAFVQTDFDLLISFLTGQDMKALAEYMCWITGGQVPKPAQGTTCTIGSLKVN